MKRFVLALSLFACSSAFAQVDQKDTWVNIDRYLDMRPEQCQPERRRLSLQKEEADGFLNNECLRRPANDPQCIAADKLMEHVEIHLRLLGHHCSRGNARKVK